LSGVLRGADNPEPKETTMSNPKKETKPVADLKKVAGGVPPPRQENPENNPSYRLPPLDRNSVITGPPGGESGDAGT
jgi:hypothetical protein